MHREDFDRGEHVHYPPDQAQITELVFRLGACLDEHRFDGIRDLLTDDVSVRTPGGTAQGMEATLAQVTRTHDGFDYLHHAISSVLVELDGDAAVVRANVIASYGREVDPPERQLGAVYRLRTRRTPHGWRLAEIDVTPVWRVEAA